MPEYIERDKALNALCQVSAPTPSESYIVEKCIDKINKVPTAKAVPIVNAYWVWKRPLDIMPVQNRLICSNCGAECPSRNNYYIPYCYDVHHGARYCYRCGAKMEMDIRDETED